MTRRKSVPAKPNPGAPKPAHVKAEALRLRRSGMPATQIAAKLRLKWGIKLAKATVQLWGDEADAEAAPLPAPASDGTAVARAGTALAPGWEAAGPPTPRLADATYGQPEAVATVGAAAPEIEDNDPTGLETMRQIAREQRKLAKEANAVGNVAAAAKALKSAGDAAEAIARITAKQVVGGEGSLTLSKEQLASLRAAARQLEEKYAADLQRTGGPVCAECGRQLRIELASKPGEPPTFTH